MTWQYGLLSRLVKIYSFMKEIKVYIRVSYIVLLFVTTRNDNFIKEIKHVIRAFIAWCMDTGENRGKVCQNSRAGENTRLLHTKYIC